MAENVESRRTTEGKSMDPERERILREQELSVERQREGRAWAGLPAEERGPEAQEGVAATRAPLPPAEEHGPTPGAAAAEEEGEPRRRKDEPKE